MEQIASQLIPLHGAARTMIGGRPENQDDMGWLDTPLGFLLVVCDGMGGGPGGKTASYIVKYEILKSISESSYQTTREMALKMAANKAHEALEQKMSEMPNLIGMGSTFVAILINQESAVIAHAGDSRCYCFRGKRCVYRSQDHSLVAELVKKKALTEEEARRSPQANIITRGLGSTTNQVPEFDEIPYRKGDRFVVCTDGIWGAMPHNELLRRFSSPSDPKQLVSLLPDEIDRLGISSGGHHDNHTIAVLDIDVSSKLKGRIHFNRRILINVLVVVSIIGLVVVTCLSFNKNKTGMYHEPDNTNSVGSFPNSPFSQPASYTETSNESNTETTANTTGDNVSDSKSTMSIKGISKDSLQILINSKYSDNKVFSSPDTFQHESSEKIDSANNTDSNNPSECEVLVQKVINRYSEAKNVKAKTVPIAAKMVDDYHSQIKKLTQELCEKMQSHPMLMKAEAIERLVDYEITWKVSSDCRPTPTAVNLMDKQIERLEELKIALKNDSTQ